MLMFYYILGPNHLSQNLRKRDVDIRNMILFYKLIKNEATALDVLAVQFLGYRYSYENVGQQLLVGQG